MRYADYNPNNEFDRQIEVVFEFVTIFRKDNNKLVEMSCGWASVKLCDLVYSRAFDLQLQGGSPLRSLGVDNDNVKQAKHLGWRRMVKFFNSIQSRLKIDVKSTAKLDKPVRVSHMFLEDFCVLYKI